MTLRLLLCFLQLSSLSVTLINEISKEDTSMIKGQKKKGGKKKRGMKTSSLTRRDVLQRRRIKREANRANGINLLALNRYDA